MGGYVIGSWVVILIVDFRLNATQIKIDEMHFVYNNLYLNV